MLFLWFFHACRRGSPRFLMVADHVNYLTFEDPGAVNTVRRALKLAEAGDLHGAAEAAGVDPGHAQVVSDALRRGMRFSLGAEIDNDPRARPDAQNIIDAMRPDGLIRCVSFLTIEHPEKGPDFAWSFDDDEFASLHETFGAERLWEAYLAKLLDDLEKLPAQIVGNFYAPARLGGWPAASVLETYEDRLLAVCRERKLAVEINTRFLYREATEERKREYMQANARLARKAQEAGVGIAVGSDAHSPKDQGNHFDLVLQMLDEAGINELVFPVAGRLARVALRATREHLEAHARSSEKNVPGSSISGLGRAELGLPEQIEPPAGRATGRRVSAANKRVGGPARPTKRAAAGSSASSKSSSKRTAASTESSTEAKAARSDAPAEQSLEADSKPGKSAKAKAPAKTATKKAAIGTTAAAKKPAKTVAKTAAKPVAKTPAKSVAKAPVKSAAKTPAKSAAKTPSKPAAKAPAKSTAKATAKPVVKKVAKAPPKAAAKKSAKSVAKPAKPAVKKPAAKSAAKKAPARSAKSSTKTASKKTSAKKSSKPASRGVKKRPAPKRR